MSGNNLFCSKCKAHHHPVEECVDVTEDCAMIKDIKLLRSALKHLKEQDENWFVFGEHGDMMSFVDYIEHFLEQTAQYEEKP